MYPLERQSRMSRPKVLLSGRGAGVFIANRSLRADRPNGYVHRDKNAADLFLSILTTLARKPESSSHTRKSGIAVSKLLTPY